MGAVHPAEWPHRRGRAHRTLLLHDQLDSKWAMSPVNDVGDFFYMDPACKRVSGYFGRRKCKNYERCIIHTSSIFYKLFLRHPDHKWSQIGNLLTFSLMSSLNSHPWSDHPVTPSAWSRIVMFYLLIQTWLLTCIKLIPEERGRRGWSSPRGCWPSPRPRPTASSSRPSRGWYRQVHLEGLTFSLQAKNVNEEKSP